MLLNYLLTAIRNFKKNSFYSFLNITGLTIGIACFILIFLWVQNQLSVDAFHKNPERIYQIYEEQYYDNQDNFLVTATPAPLAPTLKEEIPEIELATRCNNYFQLNFKKKGKNHSEKKSCAVDYDFFKIFNFPIVKGKVDTSFNSGNEIVITEKFAEKYFGKKEAIGEFLTVNEKFNLRVIAVVKSDKKRNSNLNFNYAVSTNFLKNIWGNQSFENWGSNMLFTYIKLKPDNNIQAVNEKIKYLLKKKNDSDICLFTQKLEDKYLYNLDGSEASIKYIKIFSGIAFLILIIACINFMNLSTARSANRSKEVGMRKVVGATKKQLIFQFLSESILLSIISTLLAIGLVELLLPSFRDVTNSNIYINYNFSFFISLLVISLITGLIAGSYPAFFLSTFRPAVVLKGKLAQGAKGGVFRKVLVVFQFTLSIIFIIATIFIYRQMQHIKNKDTGMNRENVLSIYMKGDFTKKYEIFRKDLLNKRLITSINASSQAPISIGSNTWGISWAEKDPNEKIIFSYYYTTYNFTKTFDIKLVAGRDFSRDIKSDSENAILINRKASEIIGKENIIGKEINWGNSKLKVIGVVEDFDSYQVSSNVEPLIISFNEKLSQGAFLKIKGENLSETLNKIETVWDKHFPEYTFDYSFLDDNFNAMFSDTQRRIKLFTYFSIVAIIISCLGLFGLAAFITQQRTKEIGVRKIMGATNRIIIRLISFDFIVLVLIANVIALPLAYIFVNDFLSGYSYKIDILENSWIFILSAFMALLIAQLTVGYQALKTLKANPVDALRYE